jgi:hypothetical protein
MSLRGKDLPKSHGWGGGKGELKNDDRSHYVIENKHTKISESDDPIISMKTKGLFYLTHYVYENK